MSNQSAKQASVRAVTGTTSTYEGDWHALFDMAAIPVGSFNGRLLAWINDYLGTSYTEINGAMAAFAIDQGFSSWDSMGTFDAAPVIQPVRVIGAAERGYNGSEGRASRDRQLSRQLHIIGTDASEIIPVANNWWFTNVQVDGTTAFTIIEASIEVGGVTAPIYFGGSRSKTINAGDNNIQFAPIPAAALGLPFFARDSQVWIKAVISVPAATNVVPFGPVAVADFGGQALWYLNGATTPSSVDAAGAFTTSGAAPETRNNSFRFILLGRHVSDGFSSLTVGDSLADGPFDTTANGAMGRGMVNRAFANSGPSDSLPHLNFGRSGIGIDAFNNGAKWKVFIPYARYAIDQILTNDVDNKTPAQMQAVETTLWWHLRSGGIEKIIRLQLLIRADSSDDWATTANQTVLTNWVNGGRATIMNDWFDTKLADSTIDYVVTGMRAAVADGVATDKWAVPKVNNPDNTHTNFTGSTTLAALIRPVLLELAAL